MTRRVVAVGVAMTGIVCLALGVGAGLLLAPAQTPAVVAVASGESVMALTPQPFTGQTSAQVTPIVREKCEYTSQASGVVRASNCAVGQEVASGSVLMTVNDSPLMALHLASPPWRDLAPGMKGADVKDFQTELARLGYSVTADGDYARATARAAEKLWESVGVKGQQGLPLAGFVWLPDEAATASTCDVGVGATASPGMPLFTSGGGLAGLTVAGIEDTAQRVAVSADGALTAPISEDGVVSDAGFLGVFEAAPMYTQWRSSGAGALTVPTQLAQSVEVVSVPPSSLYAVSGSSACLVDGTGTPRAVTIVASQLGQTFVKADPLPTAVAVSAPKDGPACG
ncbi:MAG: peptidoglycan-binding protein [Propionibacteriaceae bacterium]|jgi:hypothetical protein|nr:peptidoglycan-binding protein [Propionibacteriaceae bacterium]